MDTTISGNGKTGLIFTEYSVYYNSGFLGHKGRITYRDIANSGKIPSEVFEGNVNEQALLELLSSLANIEGKDFNERMNDMNSSLDKAMNTVDETLNLVSKGLDFLTKLLGDDDDDY